jgi:hypothetical protein
MRLFAGISHVAHQAGDAGGVVGQVRLGSAGGNLSLHFQCCIFGHLAAHLQFNEDMSQAVSWLQDTYLPGELVPTDGIWRQICSRAILRGNKCHPIRQGHGHRRVLRGGQAAAVAVFQVHRVPGASRHVLRGHEQNFQVDLIRQGCCLHLCSHQGNTRHPEPQQQNNYQP